MRARRRNPIVTTGDPHRKCQYPNPDNDDGICGFPAIRGKTLCSRHDPETRQKKAETQRGRAFNIQHGLKTPRFFKPLETMEDLIDDLMLQQAQMSHYLNKITAAEEVDIDRFANLVHLHTGNAAKISRIIKDKFDLDHASSTEILDDALDQLSEEIELEFR